MPFRMGNPINLLALPAFAISRIQATLTDMQLAFGGSGGFLATVNRFVQVLGEMLPGGNVPTRAEVGAVVGFEANAAAAGRRLQQALDNERDYIIDVPVSGRAAEGVYVNATVVASLGSGMPFQEYMLSVRLPSGSAFSEVDSALVEALDELQFVYEVSDVASMQIESRLITRVSGG